MQTQEKQAKKPAPMPVTVETIYAVGANMPELDRSLLFFLYLSGARISEALEVETKDFEVKEHDGIKQIVVRVNTRKKRRGLPFRFVPLYSKNQVEQDMLQFILRHKATYERLQVPRLYPISARRAEKKLHKAEVVTSLIDYRNRKVTDGCRQHLFPHYLRHCRATHLAQEHRMNPAVLADFMGWSSLEPALTYINVDWRQASEALLKPSS